MGEVVEIGANTNVVKEPRKIRLVVGFPHIGMVDTEFMMAMVSMYRYLIFNPIVSDDIEIEYAEILRCGGSMLPKQRDEIVTLSKAAGATHLLFIDTDMIFDVEIAHKLLRAKKEVIACNASTKTNPPNPTARSFDSSDPTGQPVFSTDKCPPIEEIWRIGTGVMLIDLEALEKIPQPWFMMTYDLQRQAHCGEDWYFCKLVRAYDIPIYIHHHASMSVGHMGKYNYTLQQVNRHREFTKQKGLN